MCNLLFCSRFIENEKTISYLINITCCYISKNSPNSELEQQAREQELNSERSVFLQLTDILYILMKLKIIHPSNNPSEFCLEGLGLTSFNPSNLRLKDIKKSVKKLDLQNNTLMSYPDFGGAKSDWENLTRLNLSGNGLSAVDKSLFKSLFDLPVIYELKRGNNNLKTLPKDLTFSLTLMVLWLDNNQLTNLPKGLEKSSISSLNLEHNKFESVPPFLCDMEWLENLNLSYNEKILEFPLKFGRLPLDIVLKLEGMQVCVNLKLLCVL